jgi:YVTN family beta-propeller protein
MSVPRILSRPRVAGALLIAAVGLFVGIGAGPASAANSTIGVSNGPATVALSPDGTRLYVTNQAANSVSVIDVATHALITTIPVGVQPFGIAVRPDGSEVYVSNLGSNTESVIDTTSNTVVANVGVGQFPYGVVFSNDGTDAFVASQGTNAVWVIDTATRALDTGTPVIPVGQTPFGVALSPDGANLYVGNQGDNTVTHIDVATKTVVGAPIATAGNPFFIAVNPASTRVYVGGLAGNAVTVIDAATDLPVATIAMPAGVRGLAVSPSGRYLFVVVDAQPLLVVDTATNALVTSPVPLPLGNNPIGMVLSGDGTTAYVVNQSSDNVSVLDVPREPAITSVAPPAASVGSAYSFTVAATGFPAPALALTGALPAGLTFDPATGVISGTPTAAGVSSFTITASGFGDPASATYTLTVAAALAATGVDASTGIASGSLLLVVGVALVVAAGVRRRKSGIVGA